MQMLQNKKKIKMLIAYSIFNVQAETIRMYLDAWRKYSGFEVYFIHATNDAQIPIDLDDFDIILNNYCVRFCFDDYVSPIWRAKLAAFKGLKILSIQDEYDYTFKTRAAILECGFDVILSVLPPYSHEYIYGKEIVERCRIIHTLTGFAPTLDPKEFKYVNLRERPIEIGYRGRDIGARYGKLGELKAKVGNVFIEECAKRNIACDISIDESRRIYSDKWFEFLGNCRAVLGSDSGSNVFDFDGSIVAKFKDLSQQLGRPPTHEEFAPYVKTRENEVEIGEISPRVFEAAFTKSALVLVAGSYSGIIEPNIHYIPINSDFTNLDEVFVKLDDFENLEKMVQRTFDDLIKSDAYSYEAATKRHCATFVEELAKKTDRVLKQDREMRIKEAMSQEIIVRDRLTNRPSDYAMFMVELFALQGEKLDYPKHLQPNFEHILKVRSEAIYSCVRKIMKSSSPKENEEAEKCILRNSQKIQEAKDWRAISLNTIDNANVDSNMKSLAVRSVTIQATGIIEDSFNNEIAKLTELAIAKGEISIADECKIIAQSRGEFKAKAKLQIQKIFSKIRGMN